MTRIAWWDWPHELLKARLADFCGSVEDFVEPTTGRDAR